MTYGVRYKQNAVGNSSCDTASVRPYDGTWHLQHGDQNVHKNVLTDYITQ